MIGIAHIINVRYVLMFGYNGIVILIALPSHGGWTDNADIFGFNHWLAGKRLGIPSIFGIHRTTQMNSLIQPRLIVTKESIKCWHILVVVECVLCHVNLLAALLGDALQHEFVAVAGGRTNCNYITLIFVQPFLDESDNGIIACLLQWKFRV